MKKITLSLTIASAFFSASINAASIDVLWYGHNSGTSAGPYNTTITSLAASAHTYDPGFNGSNTWNLTIWNPLDATPVFGNYDALVIGSGFTRFFGDFDPARLLGAKAAIESARGNRTFISGQDADWHNANNRQNQDDGPRGFLINAVNWAASGEGLGIVALTDGYSNTPTGGSWLVQDGSFLKGELEGYLSYFQDEDVIIPASTAGFPVNEGLTTAGLSNWGQSAHMCVGKDILGYASINDSGISNSSDLDSLDCAITLVTAAEIAGDTIPDSVPAVPVPAAVWLFGTALIGLVGFSKRRKAA
jgi:hypothetical protein